MAAVGRGACLSSEGSIGVVRGRLECQKVDGPIALMRQSKFGRRGRARVPARRIASGGDEGLLPPYQKAPGRARVLAGRIVSPIDEASIPPVVIRPAGSRALPWVDRFGDVPPRTS